MKKYALTFSAALAMAGAALAQPGPGRMGHGPGGPGGMGMMGAGFGPGLFRTVVTGAPYSAVESGTFVEKLEDGNTITRQHQSKIYRDSQGRVRVEHTMTPPGATAPVTRIMIFDPVAGFGYMLNPATLTANKFPVKTNTGSTTTNPNPTPHAPNGANIQTQDLGTKTVNGVPATGTRVTITIPAGAIGNAAPIVSVRETWVGTTLKVPVQITSTDPRFGNHTMNLTNISLTEPDATLFQVPSNYTIREGRGGPGAMGMGMGRMGQGRPQR